MWKYIKIVLVAIVTLSFPIKIQGDDFPSLISANASIGNILLMKKKKRKIFIRILNSSNCIRSGIFGYNV